MRNFINNLFGMDWGQIAGWGSMLISVGIIGYASWVLLRSLYELFTNHGE